MFDFCGVQEVCRRMFHVVVTSTLAQRRQWLAEAAQLALALFPSSQPEGTDP